ncbi:glycosyltransferase family 4 protein [Hyalangium gracile]|uniref:glycosyltransferase family 4 protein n=1 Tax=Hyalangium gracile TaxID=394092 RepID=UPI001CCF07D1|nr:glycosyltransferase family 4 protein [Hyalangium gracile]
MLQGSRVAQSGKNQELNPSKGGAQPQQSPRPSNTLAKALEEGFSRPLRVLCVLPGVPFPAFSGGTQRTLELMRTLAGQVELTVLAFQGPGEDADGFREQLGRHVTVRTVPRSNRSPWRPGGVLASLARGVPPSYLPYLAPEALTAFTELLSQRPVDVVHFDHLHTAQWAPLARSLCPTARLVLDEHNVESALFERLAPLAPLPLRPLVRWQHRQVRQLEAHLLKQMDLVLACSPVDGQQLEGLGARAVHVVPNGVRIDNSPGQALARTLRKDVVFVGAMDWLPNGDAALWLAKELWPRVEADLAPSRLMLIGRNPSSRLQSCQRENLVVTGTVPSVAPYLEGAWATVVPLRLGSGTRLKLLEAAAAGVPIVASPLAAEGLPFQNGREALLANTEAEFASALRYLKNNPEEASAMAQRAATLAQRYAWGEVGAELMRAYRSTAPA